MGSVNYQDIQGNANVSRNITAGGDMQIQGSGTIGHNLKVNGWLEAPNIKGPMKGLFKDEASLKSAYPSPDNGWLALVGDTLPADVWRAEGGKWIATGQKGGTFNVDFTRIEQDISNLNKNLETNVDKLTADISYLVCSTAQNAAAKTVNDPSFKLSVNCRLVIKMTNSNTVANATLNVNGTGNIPLFYNGERASASNYWDAGEVLDIFYDGTNFQASNFQGGAGEGGNMILTYTTDVATTRKSVKDKFRRAGLVIAYKNASGEWVNEQYIGTTFTDAQWQLDSNWQKIASNKDVTEGIKGAFDFLIVDWNTDVATTRKSVPTDKRKAGLILAYKDPQNGWVNEQYIGSNFTDAEFQKDSNWIQITNVDDVNKEIEKAVPSDTKELIKSLGELMKLGYSSYGSDGNWGQNNGFGNGQNYSNMIISTKNSENKNFGYLQDISINVHSEGSYTFLIGFLDQRDMFIESKRFSLQLSAGLNKVDVSNKFITIDAGEQLFVFIFTDEYNQGPPVLVKGANNGVFYNNANSSTGIENEMIYGRLDSEIHRFATTYGGRIHFQYSVKEIESPFALKGEILQLQQTIEQQNSLINRLQFIQGDDGQQYKLHVVDGEVVARPLYFRKALALGNSLTSHAYNEGLGYYGDSSWAMASTNKQETTWTNFLQTILRQKNNDATVIPFNVYDWETNPTGADLDKMFGAHLEDAQSYDLIIFRAGENGGVPEGHKEGFDRLIKYLREKFKNANIIVTPMFWHSTTKEADFQEVATKYGLPYVSFGNINDSCILGQMLMGRDNTLHPIINSGVQRHCTDVCFFDFANILGSALGYQQITGKHSVKITTSKEYGINNSTQIHKGYVTILTYESSKPSMTVKKASGDSITTQIIDMSGVSWQNQPSKIPTYAVVFQMPDEDVSVTY